MSAPLTAIDLGLVEEGIEIGKKIMAEVIATYPTRARARRQRRLQRATAPRKRTRLRKPKARILRTPKTRLKWSRPSAAATSTR